MRRLSSGLLVALGIAGLAAESRAQAPFGSVNDPFFAYYSLYLPRQAALANSPGPEATLNAVTANRQQYAATNRNGMFDPFGTGGGIGSLDPGGDDFSPNPGARNKKLSQAQTRFGGVHGGNLNGLGPQGYYNSGKLNYYYRDLRAGRGKNANVSVVRGRGFSGGGYGGGGGGLPSPR